MKAKYERNVLALADIIEYIDTQLLSKLRTCLQTISFENLLAQKKFKNELMSKRPNLFVK